MITVTPILPNNKREVRFVALGDVHGSYRMAAKAVEEARKRLGTIDAVFCVGDMEANRNAKDAAGVATGAGHKRWVGEFPKVIAGSVAIDAPIWFIGGEHEPWAMLDARGPGELYPGFDFLGRAGVEKILGMRVGFLSGVLSDSFALELGARSGRDERAGYVEAELVALHRGAERLTGLDLLITHDWPSGIIENRGTEDVLDLVTRHRPSLHICGHHHLRMTTTIGTTQVEMLGDVASGRAGYETFVFNPKRGVERV